MLPLGDELEGCKVAKGLMRAHGVVGTFPGDKLLVQGGHLQGEAGEFIELLCMGTMGPLHVPVELGSNTVYIL
jgi:hypothetical protein